jgi:hypothetical protein
MKSRKIKLFPSLNKHFRFRVIKNYENYCFRIFCSYQTYTGLYGDEKISVCGFCVLLKAQKGGDKST